MRAYELEEKAFEKLETDDGIPYTVYVNPSSREFQRIFQQMHDNPPKILGKYGSTKFLRGFLLPSELYVWPAYEIHYRVCDEIGIEYSGPYMDDDGTMESVGLIFEPNEVFLARSFAIDYSEDFKEVGWDKISDYIRNHDLIKRIIGNTSGKVKIYPDE